MNCARTQEKYYLRAVLAFDWKKSDIRGQTASSSCLERVYDAVDVLQRTKKKEMRACAGYWRNSMKEH
jgi:hypothetical protein